MNDEIDVEEFAPGLVVIITLAGAFLRVLLLGTKGMWLDETFSVWLARQSIPEMLQWIVRIDQHPPLYYVLLHYWIAHNSQTPFNARLLSVLFGVCTIPMMYLIGKRLSSAVVGLAAAILLAVSPFHVYFAQETRMYTLLTLNASLALYALVRLLTDARVIQPISSQFREYLRAWRTAGPPEPEPEDFSYKEAARHQSGWRAWIFRHRWLPIQSVETDLAWIAYIVFSSATLLTHNTAVLFLAATNVFVLGLIFFQRNRKAGPTLTLHSPSFGNWTRAQIGILLLWSPWIYFFVKQANAVYRQFWIPEPTWEIVLRVLKSFLNATGPIPAGLATVIWSLYVMILCLGLVYYRKSMPKFLFLAALFVIPFAGELIVSIWRPIFWARTLIWITIPLFLILAAGIAQLRYSFLTVLVIGVLCTINLFSTGDYYRFYQKEDWSSAAGDVALFAEEDDLVLFNSNFVEIAFDYYFETYEKGYSIQVEKRGVPLDLLESGILEPTMTTHDIPELISLLQAHDRVWLVYSHNSYTDPLGLIPQTLAAYKKLVREREFYGGQVQLYEDP